MALAWQTPGHGSNQRVNRSNPDVTFGRGLRLASSRSCRACSAFCEKRLTDFSGSHRLWRGRSSTHAFSSAQACAWSAHRHCASRFASRQSRSRALIPQYDPALRRLDGRMPGRPSRLLEWLEETLETHARGSTLDRLARERPSPASDLDPIHPPSHAPVMIDDQSAPTPMPARRSRRTK